MGHISVDLLNLYKTYFGEKHEINSEFYNINYDSDRRTHLGIAIEKTGDFGQRIFFPLTLWVDNTLSIEIDCATIRVTSKKTIIKTPVARRIGTVKEQYSIGDYVFTINGVLIGKDRHYPNLDIRTLKMIYQFPHRVELRSAVAELFLSDLTGDNRCPVVIESLEFPEKKGGSVWHIPFTMVCETDFAETLIYSEESLINDRTYVSPNQ